MEVFKRRWFMWDLARQRRFDREEFLLVINKLADLGYNGLGLYLEGAFEFKSLGGVLREGVMTYEDAAWAKEKCSEKGIFLFPLTNVVGHMEHFLRQERFTCLQSSTNPERDVNFGAPEAEEFALKIIYEYLEAFDTDYIHIGGDEVRLNEENRQLYAKFLSGLCDKLISDGKRVGVWNDLLWYHKELVAPFSREVEIFDWHYHGHRPESIEFFKKEGFKNIIVCPCENSWIGFIGHQFLRDWVTDDNKTPIESDEVEAFFTDMAEIGEEGNHQGLLTLWESTMGRDIWGQWSTIARAGLYMNGRFEAKKRNDEVIEKALFGRITPYTEIMYIIQKEIHSIFRSPEMVSYGRRMLFLKSVYLSEAKVSIENRDEYFEKAAAPIAKIEKLLEGWNTENEFEVRCKADLISVVGMMKATFAIKTAFGACRRLYTEAAIKQFSSPEEAGALALEFAAGFDTAAGLMREYRITLEKLISRTAHTETDLLRLDASIGYTEALSKLIKDRVSSPSFARIPLPTVNVLLLNLLEQQIIEK